jgi:hypothetical protein
MTQFTVHAMYDDNKQLYIGEVSIPEQGYSADDVMRAMFDIIVKENEWELEPEETWNSGSRVRWLSVIHMDDQGMMVVDWSDDYYED